MRSLWGAIVSFFLGPDEDTEEAPSRGYPSSFKWQKSEEAVVVCSPFFDMNGRYGFVCRYLTITSGEPIDSIEVLQDGTVKLFGIDNTWWYRAWFPKYFENQGVSCAQYHPNTVTIMFYDKGKHYARP